jgi:hypothetical protein
MAVARWWVVASLVAAVGSLAVACGGGGGGAMQAGAPSAAPSPSPPPPQPPRVTLADIDTMAPGQWIELPHTAIRSVLPSPPQLGVPANLIAAWSGGAVDTSRNRLLVWGGGHSDYWGNEMYALDLGTLSIRRIIEPSPFTASANCTSALSDGTPTSRHTYDGLAYIAHADRFFAVNGSLAPCGGGEAATWTYHFATGKWQLMVAESPTLTFGTMAVYDPQTRLVYVKDAGSSFFSYSLENNRYTKLNTTELFVDYHLSATIDTRRRKFVMIGDGVQVIDLNTRKMTTMATTNAPGFVTGKQSPGIDYDPVADRIVAWHGGRNVYALNMDTGAWTQVATGAGPTAPGKEQGTFGRWGYIPQYRVFALINDIDQNAWLFRLAK